MSSDITPGFSDAMRLIYAGWFIGIGVLLVLVGVAGWLLNWFEDTHEDTSL